MKTAFLVYWQDIINDGKDVCYHRDHIVCLTTEARDREMERLKERNLEDWRNDNPGEEWEPYVSGYSGERDGPHYKEVKIID